MHKWLMLAAAVALADQIVKGVVERSMALGEHIAVLPVLSWVRWHNEGAAFSILSDAAGWQRWFFVVLAVAFVGFLIYELRRLPEQHPPGQRRVMGWVYALIMGGAVGNLIDRVQHGYVVDYVLLHYGGYYFPAFNVADMALTAGAVLWIGVMIVEFRRERRARQASS